MAKNECDADKVFNLLKKADEKSMLSFLVGGLFAYMSSVDKEMFQGYLIMFDEIVKEQERRR